MIFVAESEPVLTIVRKLMNDIHQRLLMHQLVLQNREGGLRAHEPRHRRILDGSEFECGFDPLVAESPKVCDRAAIGPVRSFVVLRLLGIARIDPTLEEPFEREIERRFPETALVKRQIAERGDVPFVKDEGMAQRYRPVIKRVVVDERKDLFGAPAIFPIPLQKKCPIEGRSGDYSVPRFSCSRSIETKSALKFPFPNERLPFRWMISKKTVGRSCSGLVKIWSM
jgi:hypothetical protein